MVETPRCPECDDAAVMSKSTRGASEQRTFPQNYRCNKCSTHFDASKVADGWRFTNVERRNQ